MIRPLRTPLIPYHGDSRIFLKPENLQPFGSYKIRGVAAVIARATQEELKNGLCAASAGNMAQAVAFAARERGIPCRIYVPDTAPEVKKAAIRSLGAELCERPFGEIWKLVNGEALPDVPGLFLHPALNANLLDGYGTIAKELLEELPGLDAVVIPFGVGGLALGIARRLREQSPRTAIYLAEPATAAPFHASLAKGMASKIRRIPSFVDAIGTPEVLPAVFEALAPAVEESIAVPLGEIESAVRGLFHGHKLVCEGAGAAALAAGLHVARQDNHERIACVLSGGNMDPAVLRRLV